MIENSGKTFQMRVAFRIISLIHDNRLLSFFKNPSTILRTAGLAPGLQVLEVGCGPGFYTLPAAEIVGAHGHIYAMDVNPYAIQRIKEKVADAGVKNITPILGNAADTGFSDQSLDLVFLFGLPRIAGGRTPLIRELDRTLKPAGTVVFGKSRIEETPLAREMSEAGFSLADRKGQLLIFRRINLKIS